MMMGCSGGAVFLVLLLQLFLVTVHATSATFELFDNGASTGGIQVTLSQEEFPVGEDDDHSGELFASSMSRLINVTKYGQEPGTVRSSKAFREDGERVVNFEQLLPPSDDSNGSQLRRVYVVAEGLDFIWPFIELGHQQIVSTRALQSVYPDNPVVLESVSDSPRVFRVFNYFSPEESQALIDNALSLEGNLALKRSTVGNQVGAENEGAIVDHGRTSDNAWDSISQTAKAMITRSFNLTGIEEDAGKVDGLQIVRYKPGTFYNTHPDYFSSKSDPNFDFNPYSGGSNRFATVFMYISDVEEGGCTVFPEVKSPNPTKPSQEAVDMFRKGTLEYRLLHECHSKLVVPPKQGTAALFYSVTPDGRVDPMAHHGACPVIKGMKWGANIWIWNRQRFGDIKTGEPRKMSVINEMDENVYITWESTANGAMPPGGQIQFDTFEYHRFKAHRGSHEGETIAEFTVQTEPYDQEWIIKPEQRLGGDSNDGFNDIPPRSGAGAHSEL